MMCLKWFVILMNKNAECVFVVSWFVFAEYIRSLTFYQIYVHISRGIWLNMNEEIIMKRARSGTLFNLPLFSSLQCFDPSGSSSGKVWTIIGFKQKWAGDFTYLGDIRRGPAHHIVFCHGWLSRWVCGCVRSCNPPPFSPLRTPARMGSDSRRPARAGERLWERARTHTHTHTQTLICPSIDWIIHVHTLSTLFILLWTFELKWGLAWVLVLAPDSYIIWL